MLNNNYNLCKYRFYFILLLIFGFYIIFPYILFLLEILKEQILYRYPDPVFYQIAEPDKLNYYIKRANILKIFNIININYIFILNCIFYLLFSLFFLYFLNIKKNILKYRLDEHFFSLSYIVVLVCIIFLIKDLIDFYNFYENFKHNPGLSKQTTSTGEVVKYNIFLDRDKFYEFFIERKQTHFVIGSIFSIYCLKNKINILPILFILLVILIEVISLSRFYTFLIFINFLIFSKKKYFLYLIILIFSIIFYRLILLSASISALLHNFFWEPVSLFLNEMIKLSNGMEALKANNFFKYYFIDNLNTNFIFFDYAKTNYMFEEKFIKNLGSFSNFGLLDIVSYPAQIILLIILIFILKKIISFYFNASYLYLFTSIYIAFMIFRGSAIYGLSFLLKFQLIIILMIIAIFILKKLNFFKSSS